MSSVGGKESSVSARPGKQQKRDKGLVKSSIWACTSKDNVTAALSLYMSGTVEVGRGCIHQNLGRRQKGGQEAERF